MTVAFDDTVKGFALRIRRMANDRIIKRWILIYRGRRFFIGRAEHLTVSQAREKARERLAEVKLAELRDGIIKRPSQRVLIDQRSRVARRQRAIERDLRAQLERQGRVVTVHDDCLIGNLAICLLQAEFMAGEQSRGAGVDSEQCTRLANTSQRLVAALGLRPEVLQPKPPRLAEYLERDHDGDSEGVEAA